MILSSSYIVVVVSLLSGVLALVLGAMAYANDRRSSANRTFLIFTISIFDLLSRLNKHSNLIVNKIH